VRRRQFKFINANIAARGHVSILSDSPLVTIWAAKAGQRRSSYTVPGFRAVSSQAAVTRLASLKRAPISAVSLGENLVFGKSANDKKVPDRVDSDPYIEMSTKAAESLPFDRSFCPMRLKQFAGKLSGVFVRRV